MKEGLKITIKFITIIAVLIIMGLLAVTSLSGCARQSDFVSYNISKEADNFNVIRRLTVINARSDKVILQMVGRMSIVDQEEGLDCIVEINRKKGIYQKHFIYTNEYTIVTVEDVSGVKVSQYDYEFEIMPETLIPVKVTASELTRDIEEWREEENK